MRPLIKVVFLVVSLVFAGCDPGMTIRQENPEQAGNTILKVSVATSHNLIGEDWYAPSGVEATNVSKSPVTVTSVELVSNEKRFPYEQVGPVKYPITIAPGKSTKLPVWFDLKPSFLSPVFKNPVEFRVNFESLGVKGVTTAVLVAEQ